MEENKRRVMAIALVAVLVVAAVAVVLASGLTAQVGDGVSVTDASGQNIILDKEPQRIVSCAPAITEIVCGLGLSDKLVAVTDYDDYPAEAVALRDNGSTVGGFSTPNFEKVLSFDPDIVLLVDGAPSHAELATQLKEAGVQAVMMYAQEDLEEIYKSIELLGKVTNTEAKAEEIVSGMKAQISEVGSEVASEQDKRVMFVTYADAGFTNVWPAGKDTAIDEIVTLGGGENVFTTPDFFVASNEVLMEVSPSVEYIVMTIMFSAETPENISAWFHDDPVWKNSPAVENNNIYFLTGQAESIFNRQSLRTVEAVQLMAEILHPDSFAVKVPHNDTGVNVIGDEYQDYLSSGTASHVPSIVMAEARTRD